MATPKENQEFKLPVPPPPLLTRSTNEYFDHPSTPSYNDFSTPSQTPQGSPSKHQVPPGAYDLPNVFDNAMKLLPSSNGGTPTRVTRSQVSPTSPNRAALPLGEDRHNLDYPNYEAAGALPSSPTRKSNKENTPPGVAKPLLKKDSSYLTQAAQSREAPYKTKEAETRPMYAQRGLTQEDIEKLAKPSVKRLANVTQLCEFEFCVKLGIC
jgi:cell cycle protein kinase DBF2